MVEVEKCVFLFFFLNFFNSILWQFFYSSESDQFSSSYFVLLDHFILKDPLNSMLGDWRSLNTLNTTDVHTPVFWWLGPSIYSSSPSKDKTRFKRVILLTKFLDEMPKTNLVALCLMMEVTITHCSHLLTEIWETCPIDGRIWLCIWQRRSRYP